MCKRPLHKVSSLSFPVFCVCLANTSPRPIEQKAIKSHHTHMWTLTGASNLRSIELKAIEIHHTHMCTLTGAFNLSASQGHICHLQNSYLKSCRVKLQRKPHSVSLSLWFGAVLCSRLSWAACVLQIMGGTFLLGCPISWLRAWPMHLRKPLGSSSLPPHLAFFHLLLPCPTFSKSWCLRHKNFFTTSVHPDTLISYHQQSQDRDLPIPT